MPKNQQFMLLTAAGEPVFNGLAADFAHIAAISANALGISPNGHSAA
jgi:hypothetical protein